MLQIYPTINFEIDCDKCGNKIQASGFHLTGAHVFASVNCPRCDEMLFQELPVGSGLLYPVVVNQEGERKDNLPYVNWFTSAFSRTVKRKSSGAITIQRRVSGTRDSNKLLILSTIDQTFGHCVFALLNSLHARKLEDYHLLVLVQKSLAWLLPENLDEVWIVDLPFAQAHDWSSSLEQQVNERVKDFNSAYLYRTLPNAPEGLFAIKEFSKIDPFPLDQWNERLSKPTLTFIWRTDRFWKRVLPRIIDNSISRSVVPRQIKRLRERRQFGWILKFARVLRKAMPDVDFAIAGMDSREHRLPEWIRDYRFPAHTDESAVQLCRRYADSHLIVGCNGSSLVLPSLHAGAVLNIVPGDGIAVSVGSCYFRPTTFADMLLRYPMVNSEASIDRIVTTCVQILRDRPMAEIISGEWNNLDSEKDAGEWAKFRLQAFQNISSFNEAEGLITRKR
jgi:hypothetical protein